ncbi:hypothetical protein SLEP1_g23117 [Rubroshorea leprosula]|uniref:Uncharacterized protein n=1 Tax=Rubroshorea leprosula TaxID=152421 RepID=A0AAV5JBH9_9ROSI|nr:hypothetical protein SLEP1_g23117 [Rubroshorea leprosula]
MSRGLEPNPKSNFLQVMYFPAVPKFGSHESRLEILKPFYSSLLTVFQTRALLRNTNHKPLVNGFLVLHMKIEQLV